MRLRVAATGFVAALVLLLGAACGGGGASSTTTTATATTSAATATATTTSNVLVKNTDCNVDEVEVRNALPVSAKSSRANGAISYRPKYSLYCLKPPPPGPLKGVDSNIQIGDTGTSPTNTSMPGTDSSGSTEKTVDPLPARYAKAQVYISVYGTDGQWHDVGTTYVPSP